MYKPAVLLPLIQINLTLRRYSRLHSHTTPSVEAHCGSNLEVKQRYLEVRKRRSAEARDSTDGLPLTVRERSFVLRPPDGKVCPEADLVASAGMDCPTLAEVRPGDELGTKRLGFIRAEVNDPNEGKHLSDAA